MRRKERGPNFLSSQRCGARQIFGAETELVKRNYASKKAVSKGYVVDEESLVYAKREYIM